MNNQADRAKLASKIQALLAQAEGEAAAGNEGARDTFLEKAAALQLKYAIDDAMLRATGAQGTDELTHADFCTESNTPLIKAKRILINGIAHLNRGHAVMIGEWKGKKSGGRKYDRRAKVRVYAHQSDLNFITVLYNSLVLQMQTMMAADERLVGAKLQEFGVPAGTKIQGWRVSYAYGWVSRVIDRMTAAARRNEAAADTGQPGTALVLKDRKAIVENWVVGLHPSLRKTSYRHDDNDPTGRAAGRQAADRADLGGKKISGERRYLEA